MKKILLILMCLCFALLTGCSNWSDDKIEGNSLSGKYIGMYQYPDEETVVMAEVTFYENDTFVLEKADEWGNIPADMDKYTYEMLDSETICITDSYGTEIVSRLEWEDAEGFEEEYNFYSNGSNDIKSIDEKEKMLCIVIDPEFDNVEGGIFIGINENHITFK